MYHGRLGTSIQLNEVSLEHVFHTKLKNLSDCGHAVEYSILTNVQYCTCSRTHPALETSYSTQPILCSKVEYSAPLNRVILYCTRIHFHVSVTHPFGFLTWATLCDIGGALVIHSNGYNTVLYRTVLYSAPPLKTVAPTVTPELAAVNVFQKENTKRKSFNFVGFRDL